MADHSRPDHIDAEHKRKMLRANEAFEKTQREAAREKGFTVVHTGPGKGKATA